MGSIYSCGKWERKGWTCPHKWLGEIKTKISALVFVLLREAFQTKKRVNLGNGPKWRWPLAGLGLFWNGMTP